MARLASSPMGSGPMGPFEQQVVAALVQSLPDGYVVLPNFSLRERSGQAHEYDVVVFAPHALYVVEAKEWYGRLSGDDTEWLLNQTPKKCPLWLCDRKAKVLKGYLGGPAANAWVEPALVVPNTLVCDLDGNWVRNVRRLTELAVFIQDRTRLRAAADLRGLQQPMLNQLLGQAGKRQGSQKRRVGGYELTDTLLAESDYSEHLARRALIKDGDQFRVRLWRTNDYEMPGDRERRLNRIRRSSEALSHLGRHPNLLQIYEFNQLADENIIYEVTEWSDFGTLHGYLRNRARDPLTLRERMEVAVGVASALEATHEHNLIHRNVCPETILIGFDRKARLIDFDRAYMENTQTVFPDTSNRLRNTAYLAPELRNPGDYDCGPSADMYSLGVLLFELLTDELPQFSGQNLQKGPAALRDTVDQSLDELVRKLLIVEDFNARPSASEALAVLRHYLGSSHEAQKQAPMLGPGGDLPQFESGMIVDDYRVETRLGSGASSNVYKVIHLAQETTYAMKVLKRSEEAKLLIDEFNKVGRYLPPHPGIASVKWMATLRPPYSAPYLLTEFVDGETLEAFCPPKCTKSLAWSDIRRIGMELLDALTAMHPKLKERDELRAAVHGRSITESQYQRLQNAEEAADQGILHRDIKPANIMLALPEHRAKLIDFNIASKLGEASGQPGTPRYWAPDRGQPTWKPDMDLFSLGVVLYELITQRHPFAGDIPSFADPYDPRDLRPDLKLSTEIASFLMKSTAPHSADRFQRAEDMRTALAAVPSLHAPLSPPSVGNMGPSEFRGLTILPEETGRANYNPYVTRLLTLYSQARRSNAGTRGLDEIARLTYVNTSLDEKLAPRIREGSFRLVIVSGNAGDGKTAFIQRVEDAFREQGVKLQALPSGNGCRWHHLGLTYETNYDGSQDEGAVENDEVLARFLAPFAGDSLAGLSGNDVRLLAINEGRLLDFLMHSKHAPRFHGLSQFVLPALDGRTAPPRGALLLNLNLRAVAAGGTASLVERQLVQLLSPTLWAACEACDYREKCPLKHNADSLRDEVAGPAVRNRVRRLFEVIHLRRRAHVTMRDLRSALSWMLLRDHGCDDVATLLGSRDEKTQAHLVSLYYPDAFSAAGAPDGERVDDRLVRLLREADVGLVDAPPLDGLLDREPERAVPWMTFERRTAYAKNVLASWSAAAPQPGDNVGFAELLAARRARVARWRRWAYFERRDDGWQNMLPYRSLAMLEQAMFATDARTQKDACDELRSRVVDAVSLCEGLRSPSERARSLALRVSRVKYPSVRSFRLFPIEQFRIEIPASGALGEFLEYAPDTIELVAAPELGQARMRISLDLLEMLELIRNGYRPSPADLRGLFVNLQIFRNELLSLPFVRILVTPDDEELYTISARIGTDGNIGLALSPHRPSVAAENTP